MEKENFFKETIHFEILSENNVNFGTLDFKLRDLEVNYEQDFKEKMVSDVFTDIYLEFSTKIPTITPPKKEPKFDNIQQAYVSELKREIKELKENEEKTKELIHLLSEQNLENWKKHERILVEERRDFGRDLRLISEKYAKDKKEILEKDQKIIKEELEEIEHEKSEISKLESEKRDLIEKLTKNIKDLDGKESEMHEIQIRNEKEHQKVEELTLELEKIQNRLQDLKEENERYLKLLKDMNQKTIDFQKILDSKDQEIEKLKKENLELKFKEIEITQRKDDSSDHLKLDSIIHKLDLNDPKFEEINLSTLNLNEQSLKVVLAHLLKNSKVTKLDLSFHIFNSNMMEYIFHFIENTSILELSLHECEFDKSFIPRLKESLSKNKSLVVYNAGKAETQADIKEIELIMERNFQNSMKQ